MRRKTNPIFILVAVAIGALPLFISAFYKLSGQEAMHQALTERGLGEHAILIGSLEILSVLLYALPATQTIGFFLLNAYLGGAIAVELAGDKLGDTLAPMFLLVFFWAITLYKNPTWFLPSLEEKN